MTRLRPDQYSVGDLLRPKGSLTFDSRTGRCNKMALIIGIDRYHGNKRIMLFDSCGFLNLTSTATLWNYEIIDT